MAINSDSKLREILEDERAVAIIDEFVPGFVSSPDLAPVAGMKISTLMRFPQAGLAPEDVETICQRLDALDA